MFMPLLGRKISFGLVPGLVMLWPCWLKYDVVPQVRSAFHK
eukprot:COSAG01_NODE_11006_length_2028_cov_66.078279_1_plen_40_part_10